MPPTGKLPDEDIAAFRAWIDAGATDPRPDRPAPQPAANRLSDPTLACGFRAFQPLHAGPPPAVDDSKWPPNSATDSVKSRADTVDNRIDVLGKTFLGRCPR